MVVGPLEVPLKFEVVGGWWVGVSLDYSVYLSPLYGEEEGREEIDCDNNLCRGFVEFSDLDGSK